MGPCVFYLPYCTVYTSWKVELSNQTGIKRTCFAPRKLGEEVYNRAYFTTYEGMTFSHSTECGGVTCYHIRKEDFRDVRYGAAGILDKKKASTCLYLTRHVWYARGYVVHMLCMFSDKFHFHRMFGWLPSIGDSVWRYTQWKRVRTR